MNQPILSICAPTYNRLSHIKRNFNYFVEELSNIEEGKIEVIISNNASSDGTTEFLDSIKNSVSWIRINQNERNVGAANNMSLLLRLAMGKFVWLPGDDDYLKEGLVSSLINILVKEQELAYVYLSRRAIIERTKKVDLEGKVHKVTYDIAYKLAYVDIVHLALENFGDLKFQTSSIIRRDIALACEEENKVFSEGARAECHSLFRSIRAMQQGKSYIVSDISVVSGDEILWADSIISFLSIYDPEFSLKLQNFGFTERDSKAICDRQLAATFLFYLTHKEVYKKWVSQGKPGWKLSTLRISIFLVLRKFIRIFGRSKDYITKDVDIRQFGL